MSDDDRVAFLAGDANQALNPQDRAELDELKAALADPKLWADPPPNLEGAIVDTIAHAHSTSDGPADTTDLAPNVVVLDQTRRRRPRRPKPLILATLAAATVAAVAVSAIALTRGATPADSFEMTLAPTELAAPNTTGRATLTKTTSGWKIEVDASDLPRLENGRYYQAWLAAPDGTEVPIGTFNEGNDLVLWAGVSPRDFPTLSISEEEADNTQANSGRIFLLGTITDQP